MSGLRELGYVKGDKPSSISAGKRWPGLGSVCMIPQLAAFGNLARIAGCAGHNKPLWSRDRGS